MGIPNHPTHPAEPAVLVDLSADQRRVQVRHLAPAALHQAGDLRGHVAHVQAGGTLLANRPTGQDTPVPLSGQ